MSPIADNALLLWLQDDSNNDHQDPASLQVMYEVFEPDAPDPTELIQDDDRHLCFLTFSHDEANRPAGYLLHSLSKYPKRIGIATEYDNRWYLTAGETTGGQQSTFELPSDFFEVTEDVQVYTRERIQREIGHNPEARSLVVLTDDVEDTELVRTRRGMWIPNHYAALIVEEGLSPVEIWNRIYGRILQDGVAQACEPLVDFLRIQLLGHEATNTAFYPSESDELHQPRNSRSFLHHRNSVVRYLIPAVATNTMAPAVANTGSGLSASDLQAIIVALRSGHTAPAPAASPASPSDAIAKRWSVNLDSLLLFTLSNTTADLEPIYGSIAEAGRKLEKATIQAGYNNIARSHRATTSAPLAVTKELATTITEVIFWSGDLDRLDEGLHEFRTLYQSTVKSSLDQSAMQTYDQLATDGHMSLEEVKLFQHVLKSKWPTNFRQLDTTLKVYLNLLALLLRPTHPARIAYQLFIDTWNAMSLQLAERFDTQPAMPAQFLRSVQLRTAVYWQAISRLTLGTAMLYPGPKYDALLNMLLVQSWVAPTIPGYVPNIMPLPEPTPPLGLPAPGGGLGRPAAPGGGGGAPLPPPEPEPETIRRIENNQRDPMLVSCMEGRNFQIRSLFSSTVRPPRTTAGKEICLSYHYNGVCFSNCSRRGTHRALPNADMETLKAFAHDQIVTPNVGRGPAQPTPA